MVQEKYRFSFLSAREEVAESKAVAEKDRIVTGLRKAR